MITYYLKADTLDEIWSSLQEAGLVHKEYDPTDPRNTLTDVDEEGNVIPAPAGDYVWVCDLPALDAIPVFRILKKTGNKIQLTEDLEVDEVEEISGAHLNLRTEVELPEEVKENLPLIEAPSTPTVLWATGVNNAN